MNQPIFYENQIEKQFGNQGKKDFLGNQTLPIWIEERELEGSEKMVAGFLSPKIETFGLNRLQNPWSNSWKMSKQ